VSAHPNAHYYQDGHGNTPAAWTAVVLVFLGFTLIAVAILAASWTWFAIGAALLVVGPVLGKVRSVLARPAPAPGPAASPAES
jgi:hypothetical protein